MTDRDWSPAPIALFAFRRLAHTRSTVEALASNPLASRSKLYVFCDGARSEADRAGVAAVQDYAGTIRGFAEVSVIRRGRNFGLGQSIITGVSEMIDAHGRVIVVEDDLVTSPHFLQYMNDGLSLYQDVERVACVHGYMYPVQAALPETFFLRGADCWGWGTWTRAWSKYVLDTEVLLRRLEEQGLTSRFDLDDAYGFTEMLRGLLRKENESWDVRWHASMFLENMLTLYPRSSLVANIGCDGSGIHSGESTHYDVVLSEEKIDVEPIAVEESAAAREAVRAFFQQFGTDDEAPDAPRTLRSRLWAWAKACWLRVVT